MDSILTSIKKFIGIDDEDHDFNSDLIILINSQFNVLNQLKIGPKECFKITGSSEVWSDFMGDKSYLESVKELIGIKVRMIFDPPANSFVMQAFKERAEELEWRLNTFEDVETVSEVEEAYEEDDE